ncbi:hypothetical protein [Viscerimonas tarda]
MKTEMPLVKVEKRIFHTNDEDYLPILFDIEIQEYNPVDLEYDFECITGITKDAAILLFQYLGKALEKEGGEG